MSELNSDELADVLFISMEGQQNFKINGFDIREDVMLPVFVEDKSKFSPEQLTPDNIMTGMIKVITAEPDNQHIDYYRDFIYHVDPNIEGRLSSVAYEAEKNNHFIEAFDMFKTLIALNPDSIDTNLNLAVSYDEYSQHLAENGQDTESDKYSELAYEMFKVVEEFDEKNESAYFYLGRFYLLRENYDKAVEYFKEFVRISKDEERIEEVKKLFLDIENLGIEDEDYDMGVSLIQSEKYTDAVEFLSKYIAKFPQSWSGYYMRAIAKRNNTDYKAALDDLNKAAELNIDSSDIYNEMGLNYMNLADYSKSELYFGKALRYNPDDASIMSNLAVMNYRKGDIAAAVKYCQVILEIYPDDLKAKDMLKTLEDGHK